MIKSNSILLHVEDAEASTRFYADLLGQEPVEASPNFAMFILPSGLGLGVWNRNEITPPPTGGVGGDEIGFKVAAPEAVDALHDMWRGKGARIAMEPRDLDFGRSFLALDPDGHRLRVYALAD